MKFQENFDEAKLRWIIKKFDIINDSENINIISYLLKNDTYFIKMSYFLKKQSKICKIIQKMTNK
jgi:hypothetical protein